MRTQKLVYFIRHGESEANRGSIFQSPDDRVTERGYEQNACIAGRMATVPFETLIASPFPRARATADAIANATGKPVVEDALWREYVPPTSLLGSARDTPEGQAFMRERRAHMYEPKWHFEDEENYHDLNSRAGEALLSLLARPEESLVVVTHLGFLKTILAHMVTRGRPSPQVYANVRFAFESKNAAITLCRYGTDKKERTGWRLVTWNDYTHLPEELW